MSRWLVLILWGATLEVFPAVWAPAKGPLMTKWAKQVSPRNALPEYPRPQLARNEWLNLNGLWNYAIAPNPGPRPAAWDGEILVPFPVESALSGVMKTVGPDKKLWYHRTFQVPRRWEGRRVLLHFGAVDWEARVWVNGVDVGEHRGGYDAFSIDVTDALKPEGAQELVVSVWDPSDAGPQPRGKQVQKPEGIWYTPTTGIWQTVWVEPVEASHVRSLKITPDFDGSAVEITALVVGAGHRYRIEYLVRDGRKEVVRGEASVAGGSATRDVPLRSAVKLGIPGAKPWTPDTPFLYGLRVTLYEDDREVDAVESYFGLRKIAVAKDASGVNRLFLNNQPVFQFGPLDQGFWPDGLYTAPTDEALQYDIRMTKEMGFNMARKHVKVEPDRWYYWCDVLGLLVWQDMPSGEKYIGGKDPDIQRSPESAAIFERELRAMVEGLGNHPSIVMWVPYNEGWGQWDTARIAALVKEWDPTRLVNSASGWTDRKVGDVHDIHVYPGPGAPPLEANRAGVLGEYGGLGLPVKGHTWQAEKNWGYRSFTTHEALTDAYLKLIDQLHPLTGEAGLSAAIYTQTTDVEIEVNGLMTYDRERVKMKIATVAEANRRVYAPPPPRRSAGNALVPPATPLVAGDPYFSIWSVTDRLTDDTTRHWTGKNHALVGLVRIDGVTYRVMGNDPRRLPALEQTSVDVLPTRTEYQFEGAGIRLGLRFQNATLPDDLDLLSRPVTYLTWEATCLDGRRHDVGLYFEASPEIVVNTPDQKVLFARADSGDVKAVRVGTESQSVLGRKGDDVRIDWGHLYLAAARSNGVSVGIAAGDAAREFFREQGKLVDVPPIAGEPVAARNAPGLVAVFDSLRVGAEPTTRWLMLAYDDEYAIQYMGKNLRPYWRRNGWEAKDLLQAAATERAALVQRCDAFDQELMADLVRQGGEKYAKLAALAFRQCFAASKFVADANGQALSFSKENFSNGCIGTSDVFYPMAPQFLLFGSSLAKSFLVPFMDYAASERWRFPFAPHDLGTYPHANGQVYGGGERTEDNQMPVEESGNLLILMAAVAQMEGNAGFAGRYWPQLERWAAYLADKGFDPENQLCTDDFAGHLAHNVNLSAKAICGLGAFSKLCGMRGDTATADRYRALARGFADRWVKEADDGEKFRLAFDRPGTWSQKYNLVWDRILGLNLFPRDVATKEMAFYRKTQARYGLPLDNRATYTKLDWIVWTATLTGDRGDFEALVDPVFRWLNETGSRVPMSDWYETVTGRQVGFQARPVVGGVYLPMLYDVAVWQKYASRDVTRAANWAPMPKPPKLTAVVPTAREAKVTWRYTLQKPAAAWSEKDFDDSNWSEGTAGFGTRGTPGSEIGTVWSTTEIWLRRAFEMPAGAKTEALRLMVHHDEDAEVFLNGVLVATLSGYTSDYEPTGVASKLMKALQPGRNVLAIRCRQTGGGQYIDAGLVTVEETP
jgi:beta-galactosidase/beta-glucuronidase